MNDLPCSSHYLKITDENKVTIGKYCGVLTGKEILVAGDYAVITFHSNCSLPYKEYRLIFATYQLSIGKRRLVLWVAVAVMVGADT